MSHAPFEASASYAEIISLARSRRAALARDRVQLDAEIAKLDELIKLAGSAANVERTVPDSIRFEEPVVSPGTDATPAQIVRAACQALEAAGRPLGRAALYRAVLDAGVVVPGRNPIKNFGTILWRSAEIENGIEGYVLPGWDYAR